MSYKNFNLLEDVTSQLSTVNEVIPLTGSFFSGTDFYTKKFINITSGSAVSGGFWETVYDGAPASISSSALVDMTYGQGTGSLLDTYGETFLKTQKNRVYKQMAKLLLGSEDNLFSINSVNRHEMFFLLLKRRIYKDEIKKGDTTFTAVTASGSATQRLTLSDAGAASSFDIEEAGDEASLFSASTEVGKVYYNAGIIAIATGAFIPVGFTTSAHWSGTLTLDQVAITGTIDNMVDGLRQHTVNNGIRFLNQTNLHSTIYFCRKLHNEFNYSSNPTFLDSDGRVLPTSGTDNQTRSYATKIGLYDINNNQLGVASLSEPIKFSPDNEVIIRTRLDFAFIPFALATLAAALFGYVAPFIS